MTLEQENETLRRIISEIWWMARRYADGRQSYAASMFNDNIKLAKSLGVVLRESDGTIFARDGMGYRYSGITEEEHNLGIPLKDYEIANVPQEYEAMRAKLKEQAVEIEKYKVIMADCVCGKNC